MSYSEALEAQIAALGHVADLARIDGQPTGESEREVARILEHGETYYWAAGLCSFVQGAAEEFPENWRWTAEGIPTRDGFLWFARPLVWETGMTVGDRFEPHPPLVLRAIGWSVGTTREAGQDLLCAVAFTDGPRHLNPLMIIELRPGQSIAERFEDATMLQFEGRSRSAAGCLLITLGACLTFLEQRILVTVQHRAERHARKRLERQGYQSEALIRVVELRRKQARSAPRGDAEPVEWSCQWVVSGHWRQQWYPSLNANQPRWVMPYIKGPPEKPLKPPRATIFAVIR